MTVYFCMTCGRKVSVAAWQEKPKRCPFCRAGELVEIKVGEVRVVE